MKQVSPDLLAAALPYVIVPLSDATDPLHLLDWTEGQGKQPNWQRVAEAIIGRLPDQPDALRATLYHEAMLGPKGVTTHTFCGCDEFVARYNRLATSAAAGEGGEG